MLWIDFEKSVDRVDDGLLCTSGEGVHHHAVAHAERFNDALHVAVLPFDFPCADCVGVNVDPVAAGGDKPFVLRHIPIIGIEWRKSTAVLNKSTEIF